MPGKRGLWLGVILLTVGLIWWIQGQLVSDPTNDSIIDQTGKVHSEPAMNTPTKTADNKTENQAPTADQGTTSTTQMSTWHQQILNEIEMRVFSEDPYVELYSLEALHGQCKEQSIEERLFVGGGTFYAAQQQLTQELAEKCRSIKATYPQFMDPATEEVYKRFEPSSRMGRLLKQTRQPDLTQADRAEIATAMVIHSVKEQNGSTLLETVFSTRFGSLPNLPLADILGTKDQEYVNQMSSLALMKLACQYQSGQVCDSTSFYMIILCSQSPTACGLNFTEWFEQNTLPGMQRDVEILTTYFAQLGQ